MPTVRVEAFVPVPRVSDLQTELAVNVGCLVLVKFASPMMASTEAVGTPAVQLAAMLQSVLAVPFHDVWAVTAASESNHPSPMVIKRVLM